EWQREVFVAVTNDIRLQPGDVIELKEHPKQHFNKRYRVLTLTHKGKQISGINLKNFNEDKTSHYHNQAILIPENISYKKPCQYTLMQDCRWCDSEILRPEIISDTAIYKNNLPSLLAGKLIGNNKNETDIDSEGCYALQMRFPEENSEELDNQHRIQLLQPYGGQFNKNSKAYGLHFPFKVGSEVAVTHSNENYSLILGGIPNLTALTPVNNHNFSQNILRTWRNQEFCMDDLTRQSGILLATEHENQKLLLSTEKETNGVYCRSEFGEIKLHFAKEFISTVGQDHTIQAQMQKIVVNEDCHIFTELGEIYYRSGNQINLAANKDVLFASRENFETDAKTDFSATSKNHFYFYTRIGNSTIYSQQGDISLKSHGQMSLQAHQKFSLLTGMASIGINPSGQMILQAGSITFSSPVIHVYPA
ncbi:MAG: hypothetical protein JSS53_09915, partial [Proteobacteria bacterium]|nr:hypothetical protein [Pseudomonadota bacterium]